MNAQAMNPVPSAWRGAIRALQLARPTMALGGLFVVAVFWLLTGLRPGFSRSSLLRDALPLPPLLILAVVSTVMQLVRRRRSRADLVLTSWVVLVNTLTGGFFLVTLSAYSLLLAIQATTRGLDYPAAIPAFVVGLYAFSTVSAVVWSPRSIPMSRADDDQAAARDVKWLPLILGAQASLIGLGVFLSAFAARTKPDYGYLWLGGVSALGAAFMVFFGVLFVYRFVFLALHPIPPEVQEEFGLRR